MQMTKLLSLIFLPLLVSACASSPTRSVDTAFERDRAAILAMAGEFKVSFKFDETVALRSGYTLAEPKRSSGDEFVQIVADSGTKIVLQHILLGPKGLVIKHWRQDWTYQDQELWEFAGDRNWRLRRLAPSEVRGQWSQAVFEVDDSPRYESIGRWEHAGSGSSWVSADTWRPLPRREFTTRSDYDVLLGNNRHTITPDGWVHEQQNTKFDRQNRTGEPYVAREMAVNDYRRITDFDFSPARAYWQRTAPFWERVRATWDEGLQGRTAVEISTDSAGRPVMEQLFALAEATPIDLTGIDSIVAAALQPGLSERGPRAAAR